jgi:hypothetical protein
MPGDFMKGGLRYKRLKKAVPERVAPEALRVFFIGVPDKRQDPSVRVTAAARALLKKEVVIAVTDERLHLIPITGAGVFSSKLGETLETHPVASAPVRWDGSFFTVGERVFQPFSYHDDDAAEAARILGL